MSRRLLDGKRPKPKPGSNQGGRPRGVAGPMQPPSPETMAKIEAALRLGSPIETAFGIQDIAYSTLRQWVIAAKEHPDSEYGALLRRVQKALCEWEISDLAVIQAHAQGRPAQYLEEPITDAEGRPERDLNGRPLMKLARDADGNPIIKNPAIKSDWRASMERMHVLISRISSNVASPLTIQFLAYSRYSFV